MSTEENEESPGREFQKHQLEVMMDELNRSNSPRAESLLFTNFVEMLVKDFMVLLMDTAKARKINRDLIVEILEAKQIIDSDLSKDIKLIFDIRDQLAHNINWIILKVRLDEILKQMNVAKQKSNMVKDWEKLDYSEKVLVEHPKYNENVKLVQDKRSLDCIGNFTTTKGVPFSDPDMPMVTITIPRNIYKRTLNNLKKSGCEIIGF